MVTLPFLLSLADLGICLLLIMSIWRDPNSWNKHGLGYIICLGIGGLITGTIIENEHFILPGVSIHIIGYLFIGTAILLTKRTGQVSNNKPDSVPDVPELTRLLKEKTEALEMANMLLTNEMEVRSSFEADLQESEEKFRTMAEITPLGMMLINKDNSIEYMNPQVTRSLGYSHTDIPDVQSALQALIPDVATREIARARWEERAWSTGRKTSESEPAVYRMNAKDGSERIIEIFFAPYGQVLLALLNDITARKKAEDELHESDRRYREMMEKIPLIAVILDPEGNIIFCNDYLLELVGTTQDAIMGTNWFETFTLPEEKVKEVFLQFLQDKNFPYQLENAILTKNQEVHSILWTNLILQDMKGSITGVVSLGTDITERKLREQAIQLANKKLNILSSISRHDISNGLTELFLSLELTQDDIKEPVVRDLISNALEAIRMIRHQIEFTRFYQDIGVQSPEWYNLETIINQAISDLPSPHITFSIQTENAFIYADPLIQKVFFNLIDNAGRHGERVTSISFTLDFQGSDLIIRYADDGIGVPPQEKEKIFERGFGKHTGMGLFLIREILTITGIKISETGEYGKGAEFILIVPKGHWHR